MKIGKFYTGNQYCFQGTIQPLEILEEENILKVKLTNSERTMVWEEDWNLQHSIQGLETGEYFEIFEMIGKSKILNRFSELLEKRRIKTANIFEEEELIKLAENMTEEELVDVDRDLLTFSNRGRLDDIFLLLDKLDKRIDEIQTKKK